MPIPPHQSSAKLGKVAIVTEPVAGRRRRHGEGHRGGMAGEGAKVCLVDAANASRGDARPDPGRRW
jgi:hypothetical protein